MTHGPDFPLLGEPLAIDLVNTRMCQGKAVVDLLNSPAALQHWLNAEKGRVGWKGRVSRKQLELVKQFRDTLGTLLHAALHQQQPAMASVGAFNEILASPHSAPQLEWPQSGPQKAPAAAPCQSVDFLDIVARDALELLTGPRVDQLRECAHPACILLFVANHPRRRWCSPRTCGNRARVARHYRANHDVKPFPVGD